MSSSDTLVLGGCSLYGCQTQHTAAEKKQSCNCQADTKKAFLRHSWINFVGKIMITTMIVLMNNRDSETGIMLMNHYETNVYSDWVTYRSWQSWFGRHTFLFRPQPLLSRGPISWLRKLKLPPIMKETALVKSVTCAEYLLSNVINLNYYLCLLFLFNIMTTTFLSE